MALPIPPLQDVVRLTGPDVDTTLANLRRHLQSSGPVWGYNSAKRMAKAVFSSNITRDAAIDACSKSGHPLGRIHNAEVGGLIWDATQGQGPFLCHDVAPRFLNLRADIAIKVDPLFFFVKDGRPVMFYLQPRRKHVPGLLGLRLISSAIHTLFAVDELTGSEMLLLDLSMPEGGEARAVSAYSYETLPPLSTHEIEAFFQRFVDAYDVLTKEGVTRRERRPQPTRDLGDDLFGPSPA